MTKRYVKIRGDTANGDEGIFYYEIQDDLITRQICVVNGRIFWADEESEADDEYPFTDQPEFVESEIPVELDLKHISEDEFEAIWREGKDQCR